MISELLVNIANKIKSIKDGVAAVYAAISSKGGTLPEEQTLANLPSAIEGMPSGGLKIVGGVTLDESVMQSGELNLEDLLIYKSKITDIKSDVTDLPDFFMAVFPTEESMLKTAIFPNLTYIPPGAFLNNTSLISCIAPKVTNIYETAFEYCYSLLSVDFPLVTRSSSNAFAYDYSLSKVSLVKCTNLAAGLFRECMELTYLNMPKASTITANAFFGCSKLIDLIIGRAFSGNKNLTTANYNPTEAMSTESSSLLEEGETFANNNEKWNYNLREHFAANLTDRSSMSTKYTITFGESVLAAMTDETKEAFTSKGWTLA